jgi:cysteine desulfurase / selenocysteine lyase
MSTALQRRPDIETLFDVHRIREEFPILREKVHGKPLVYLDNGATTQKPQSVIDATSRYYASQNANIHRGVYQLSQLATTLYEDARKRVQRFINAADPRQVIFTNGTTDGINLVAMAYGRHALRPGDEIILTTMEHHSNIVPWQLICEQTGATIRVVPVDDDGDLDLDEYRRLFTDRTRIAAFVHVSNSLGTINPAREMIRIAKDRGVVTLVDGAQWVAHAPTDVQELGCDFYVFSGHKLYGPTGIGILYGRRELMEAMPPYKGGGDMIASVSFEKTTYNELPAKFEAGTPNIAGAIGLAAAIDFVESVGFDAIGRHESALLKHATERLKEIPGLRILGEAREKAAVISFVMEEPVMSALDVGVKLDNEGIAVRTGHHCCQPLMERYRIPATVRASFGIYNTVEEINALVDALTRIRDEQAHPSNRSIIETEESIPWPGAAAGSPQAAADELAEYFSLFGSRDEKNQFLMDLAAKLPHTFDVLKTVSEPVQGCMSQVYVLGRSVPGQPDRLEFLADADAEIVRGLIALLQRLYSGQNVDEILKFDVESFFERIGLEQFVTSQRRNGLAGMVRRIRGLAEALKQGRGTA